jgi:hypothetical protein
MNVFSKSYYDQVRPHYIMYNGNDIVATAKTGKTHGGRRKMEIKFGNRIIHVYRNPSGLNINEYGSDQAIARLPAVPTKAAIDFDLCGYRVSASKTISAQYTTSKGTKVVPIDAFHLRNFCIERITEVVQTLDFEIMCMIVYFWERATTVSYLDALPTGFISWALNDSGH